MSCTSLGKSLDRHSICRDVGQNCIAITKTAQFEGILCGAVVPSLRRTAKLTARNFFVCCRESLSSRSSCYRICLLRLLCICSITQCLVSALSVWSPPTLLLCVAQSLLYLLIVSPFWNLSDGHCPPDVTCVCASVLFGTSVAPQYSLLFCVLLYTSPLHKPLRSPHSFFGCTHVPLC